MQNMTQDRPQTETANSISETVLSPINLRAAPEMVSPIRG
jgi:hypothetical protein